MPEERKTKLVAQRIDPRYVTRRAPMRSFRRLVIVLCATGALAWWGWHLRAGNERLYNPGPVAAVHAMFEDNCGSCHDGKGNQFFKTVSDNACLRCHDAAIHFGQQVDKSSDHHKLIALENGKPVRSAQCIACHTEHKGHAALKGVSDLLCTQCHGDLPKQLGAAKSELPNAVTGFGTKDHPRFGRRLKGTEGSQAWYDPTPLKFDHAKHQKLEQAEAKDCATCHRQSSSGDRHIMLPVSYEANCQSCHAMTVVPGVEVPHQSMEVVRPFMAAIPASFEQKLRMMTPAEKTAVLETTVMKRVGLRQVPEKKVMTEAEWIDQQTQNLIKKIGTSAAGQQPAYKEIDALPPAAKTAAAMELYAAYGLGVSCSYCHTVEGSPAGVAKTPAQLLRTLPTGFHLPPPARPAKREAEGATPAAPATAPAVVAARPTTGPTTTAEGRRWFTGSIFDHHSHRAVQCADCHAQAKTSALTTDVLMPDIDSCVKCHESGPGVKATVASSSCVTCHVYHDRSQDADAKRPRMTIAELLAQGSRK